MGEESRRDASPLDWDAKDEAARAIRDAGGRLREAARGRYAPTVWRAFAQSFRDGGRFMGMEPVDAWRCQALLRLLGAWPGTAHAEQRPAICWDTTGGPRLLLWWRPVVEGMHLWVGPPEDRHEAGGPRVLERRVMVPRDPGTPAGSVLARYSLQGVLGWVTQTAAEAGVAPVFEQRVASL